MNLLTNASEAVGDSPGTITLVTGSVHADRAYLAGAFVDEDIPEGDYVFLDVSDTGCGMDAETRAKIFDPFFSTKFSGRGLGLAAVLGIVRGHRGAVRVYSEPGQGTAVKVLFPAAEKGTAVPHRPSEEAPAPRDADFRGSGTVLVIDDEPSVRDVARAILERAGFEVLVAASGREGLERFRAGADRIVAVLLDMTMPDFSGEEVFAELRSIRPGVPVILSSGYNEQDATRRFAPAGLAGFIQKPYLPADLLSKVRAALRV
jgi:CheY-like chemotaxis protein